jgi:hypothetical protein
MRYNINTKETRMENKRDIIYDLIDHLGGPEAHTIVLKELIRSMKTKQIVEFVQHFKQMHDIKMDPVTDEVEVDNDPTEPPMGSSKFKSLMGG